MKITVKDIRERKKAGKKITCLTAYDYPTARMLDEAGIDIILVGDSLGTVLLGYESTCSVTMRDMLHHVKAVSRAVKNALVVADMPFGSYESSPEQAYRNAKRLIQTGGAACVKLEGGKRMAEAVAELVRRGIPVMGHVGLTPQTAEALGGYKVQGRTPQEAENILSDARALERAGAFGVVLECVPTELAKQITHTLTIPTIGIGAGVHADGQVLVSHDMLGLLSGARPRFVRRYAELDAHIRKAVRQFKEDVLKGRYPSAKESYGVSTRARPAASRR